MLVFIIGIILATLYFFLFSQSGLLERLNLEDENRVVRGRIEKLNSEKVYLQNTLRGYKRGNYSDKEMLESGYIKPGEKIIYFKGHQKAPDSKDREKSSVGGFFLTIGHLRLIWIAFSAAVLVCFIIYMRRKREFTD